MFAMAVSMPSTRVLIAVVFLLAAIVAALFRLFIHRKVNALDSATDANRLALRDRARRLVRTLALLAFGVATLVAVSLLFDRSGVPSTSADGAPMRYWLLGRGVNILLIVVGAMLVIRTANLAIEHLQHRLGGRHAHTDLEWQRRSRTLSGILTSLVTVSVSFVAVLMLLRQLTIDVVPILTAAGIGGLAIGFGAQNLVRDVISGFFLILEDQVRVGDTARINGIAGTVEQVNLRTIVVRDGEGAVQVFPNGTITALANLSKHFAYAVVDVRVTYGADIDRVVQTIHDVGSRMQHEEPWSARVVGPIEVMGVESLADGFATVRMRFKTLPLHQGSVANELRRRILAAFVAAKIRPFAMGPVTP
jgi:small-conductance mechanosensitive channel